MLTVFTRTIILYIVSVLAIRLMGKRQVGQLQPYEFVLALMIAELAAAPMEDIGTPLLYGLVPILGMMILHGLADKSRQLRIFVFPEIFCSGRDIYMKQTFFRRRENYLALIVQHTVEGPFCTGLQEVCVPGIQIKSGADHRRQFPFVIDGKRTGDFSSSGKGIIMRV